jgi:hypothetical protein
VVEQLTGAGVWGIIVLGYVLLAEAMTAAIVMLAQFTVLQVRSLRTLAVVEPEEAPTPAPAVEPLAGERAAHPQVVIGGGLKRWE